ncbi:MAG: MmcQ/YjbR family DNA-binding protein [Acidobacteriota bacterium]
MTHDEFRQIVLSFPETEERSHMNHPDFRVGGKIFATLGPDLTWGMAKLTPEQQQEFLGSHPAVFKPAAGKWGEGGATLITLANADEETVGEALTFAWQNTAPKHLLPLKD